MQAEDGVAPDTQRQSRAPLLVTLVTFACVVCGLVFLLFGSAPAPLVAAPSHREADAPMSPAQTGSVIGFVWEDLNGDGVADQGEPPLSGAIITARNVATDATSSATSGSDGKYRITGLPVNATYDITAAPPPLFVLTTQGSYPIVMDVAAEVVINFGAEPLPTPTPTPTTPPMLDPEGAERISCGGVYAGDTQTGTNNVARYSCRPWWDESGKEVVYRFELSSTQPVILTLLNTSTDLDLFLLADVFPTSCLAAGDNYLSHTAAPGEYLVSVDGYRGTEGTYLLRAECPGEPQATVTPTLTPSPTPTPTATGTPTATPTTPPMSSRVRLPLLLDQ